MTDDEGLSKKNDINIFYPPSFTNEDFSSSMLFEVAMANDIFDHFKG